MKEAPLILVADDEPLVAHTLVEILKAEGFRAISVTNGAAAVEWAERARPAVVICDVMMPTLDGIEAAKRIRKLLPDTEIVLFSGQAASGSMIDRACAEGYTFKVLPKPIRPDLLLQLIREMTGMESTK